MLCPRCGSNQSDEVKFCKSCGANLQAVRDVLAGHLQIVRERMSVLISVAYSRGTRLAAVTYTSDIEK